MARTLHPLPSILALALLLACGLAWGGNEAKTRRADNQAGMAAGGFKAKIDYTDLIKAARDGDLGRMEQIVKMGVPASSIDGQGRTALHWAAEGGHADTAAELVRLGANPNARDHNGRMPLHLAAERGHLEMVNRLLELGARPRETDYKHMTAGMLAERAGKRDVWIRLNRAMEAETPPLHVVHTQQGVNASWARISIFGFLFMTLMLGGAVLILLLLSRGRVAQRKAAPANDTEVLERIMRGLDKMEQRTANLEEILVREDQRTPVE